jgi:hypothetical protein
MVEEYSHISCLRLLGSDGKGREGQLVVLLVLLLARQDMVVQVLFVCLYAVWMALHRRA